jgi:3-oxoacyl-[acyl-carrier-protein] synthase II
MRRIVVTGLGVVSPLGSDAEASWAALLEGRSGIGAVTRFDTTDHTCRIAGEANEFDPSHWFDVRELRKADRFLQLALAASRMAVADSGLEVTDDIAERVGVYVGSGVGGLGTICDATETLAEKGPRRVSPFTIPKLIINMAPGMISIETGAKGPNFSSVSACATGNHCIGEAFRAIRGGMVDACIAGGAEAPILSLAVASFARMRALSTRNDDPAGASRPFDADRDGFVMAEGAGLLVLEELEFARARGADIYAELVGYGLNSDAYHITQPSPDGDGAVRCMRLTLDDARLDPSDVGYINAHGTSTPFNDRVESAAIRRVFGAHAADLAVSSTKSMTGHLLGAAGGLEAAFACLTLQRGVLPATINQESPDPDCDLDYVPNEAREQVVDTVLSNAFGFGGTNACLAFRRFGS